MKASELRIGNWVDSGDHFGEIQVQVIQKDGINPFDWGQGNHCIHFYESIKPIPLTEEWLMKFGFEKNIGWDDMVYYILNGVDVYEMIDYYEYADAKIKHVHQLQNLYFALTGEELKKEL